MIFILQIILIIATAIPFLNTNISSLHLTKISNIGLEIHKFNISIYFWLKILFIIIIKNKILNIYLTVFN